MPYDKHLLQIWMIILSAPWQVGAATVEYWSVRGGTTTLFIGPGVGQATQAPSSRGAVTQPAGVEPVHSFAIDADSTLFVTMSDGVIVAMTGAVRHAGAIPGAPAEFSEVVRSSSINLDSTLQTGTFSTLGGRSWLILRDLNVQFDRERRTLVVTSDDLVLTSPGDGSPGRVDGTPLATGMASIKIELKRVDEPAVFGPKDAEATAPQAASRATVGPDVIVSELDQLGSFGSAGTCSGSGALCTNTSPCPPPETCENKIAAFSVATRSCNAGDAEIDWFQSTNRHPVISQTMFRLANDRFEQVGMAWVKHGFSAINGTFCGACQPPAAPNQTSRLGVGCSDPYTATLNGDRTYLGPRSDIDPHTGSFTVPFNAPPFDATIGRRLQVYESDLDPALNPGALYFVEGHYVTPDDAAAGNGNNNASYRRITIDPPIQSNNFRYVAQRSVQTGLTQVGKQAIRAWKDFDGDVVETDVQVSGEGLFILAAKATDLGTGFWHYEYALQNMNSEDAASSFTVPLPPDAQVQNPGFHDVDYHSGEAFDGTDWAVLVDPVGRTISWSTQTYSQNPDANALRWGTLYNFRFDVNAEPDDAATVTLGLFKGPLPSVAAIIKGPSVGMIDCNRNGIPDACDSDCLTCNNSGQRLSGRAVTEGQTCGTSLDCNCNCVPDECERDCEPNGIADTCDIAACPPGALWCADCNENTVPDGCEADCDRDGVPTACDLEEDTDGDGLDDCLDACPRTFSQISCTCPDPVCCCLPFAGCACFCDTWSSQECLDIAGIPDCIESNKCRGGCLLGDADESGGLDLSDFAAFQACFLNPETENCLPVFDFTLDSSVDLDDFGPFIDLFQGGGGTSNPCQ